MDNLLKAHIQGCMTEIDRLIIRVAGIWYGF